MEKGISLKHVLSLSRGRGGGAFRGGTTVTYFLFYCQNNNNKNNQESDDTTCHVFAARETRICQPNQRIITRLIPNMIHVPIEPVPDRNLADSAEVRHIWLWTGRLWAKHGSRLKMKMTLMWGGNLHFYFVK